ncbi:YciI family protein [Ancylomarina longa]|nr:YciI family protein [Ancylomarina longa]
MKNITKFNAKLAKELQADQYGMSKYIIALLKKSSKRNHDSQSAEKLQKAHLENIGRLLKKSKFVLAVPFLDDDEIRGVYIFNVETIEEAKTLTESDPVVKAGRLVVELHSWYGSAALKQLSDLHESISKGDITL